MLNTWIRQAGPRDPNNPKPDGHSLVSRAAKIDEAVKGFDGEIGDLVADILHWCDREGVDFEDVLETARAHHDAEVKP